MGRRNTLKYFKLEDATSTAASFNTTGVDVTPFDVVAFNINCTSVTDNTGTFTVEHRMVDGNDSTAWASVTLAATLQLSNAAATFRTVLTDLAPGEIRVVFTAAGSTPDGVCDIVVSANTSGA